MEAKVVIIDHKPLNIVRAEYAETESKLYTIRVYDSFGIKDLCKSAGMRFDAYLKIWYKDAKTMESAKSIASSLGSFKIYNSKDHGKFGDFLANFWSL